MSWPSPAPRAAPLLASVLLGLFSACAATSEPGPRGPGPRASAEPLVIAPPIEGPPSASASGAKAPEPAPGPPVPEALRETFEALSQVCDARVEQEPGAEAAVGCQRCPPFAEGAAGYALSVRRVVKGSFSRAGAEQAVVFHAGCVDFQEAGGAFLIEKTDGRWNYVAHVNEGLPDPLHTVRLPDGREVLVGYVPNPMPARRAERVVVYDFARGEDERARRFVELGAFTVPALCVGRDSQAGRVHQKGAFEKLEVRDVDGDGVKDIVVKLTYARFAPDASFDKVCARWLPRLLTQEDALEPLDRQRLRPRPVELTWVWKAGDFVPTFATRKKLGGEGRQLLRGFD